MRTLFTFLGIALMSSLALADLPNPSYVNNYGQYTPPGTSNQFNSPYNVYSQQQNAYLQLQQRQQAQAARMQKVANYASTVKDLLWLFTSSDSTFGKRLFYVFSQALDRRYIKPLQNQLGNLQNTYTNSTAYQNPYGQTGAGAYCATCAAAQRYNNPYATNPQAINPQVFNGNSSATTGGNPTTGRFPTH